MTGTVKLDGWQPQEPPDLEETRVLRRMVVETVYAHWSKYHQPINLAAIWRGVHKKIVDAHATGQWRKQWGWPGKRTVDRRVNEAADPRFYTDGVPKIVAKTAGVYTINPKLLEAEK